MQVDLKGIPILVMNLVLKRHPLAIHYVRQQMIDPKMCTRSRHTSTSSAMANDYDDDDDDDSYLYQSMELPDDFIPGNDSDSDTHSNSYEQSMPMEFFTKL